MTATITIVDKTATAKNLYQLLYGGAQTGYTVVSSDTGDNLPSAAGVNFISIQASYGNGGAKVYVGGSKVANDGTNQGRELLAGDIHQYQQGFMPANLNSIYLMTDTNDSVVNVEFA